jgi:hypothetical protein
MPNPLSLEWLRCIKCAQGIKHTHPAPLPERGVAERKLLSHWLAWAEEWGDADMRQSLIARTKALLEN